MDVLKLDKVSMNFGKLSVLEQVSFSVPEHSAFGLIGKNGAGKTTTMKLILGFLKPSEGRIDVCGERVVYGNAKTNRFIGYLPDVPEFYGYLTPKEYLNLCGKIAGLSANQIKEKSEELLRLVGLDGVNRKISGFSRGMKQRLGIAQALMNEPKLLICDEPTSALDPVGRKEILDILKAVKEKTTVVFSSHILSDVEKVCDRIGILDNGKLLLTGSLREIKERYRKRVAELTFFDEQDASDAEGKLKERPFVFGVKRTENALTIQLTDDPSSGQRLLGVLLAEGWMLKKYEIVEPSLEHVFLEAVEG